jgi:glutamate racemase
MIGLVRLVITDSGLGGLSVCAAIERDLRASALAGRVRLTYVNAWPEEGRGYNDFPDDRERAAVFDRALTAIAEMRPDVLLIACNTLSILFGATRFSHTAPFPVEGIIDAGVGLFVESLRAAPGASIVLLGTRTTIASGAHRNALIAAGIAPGRVSAVSCHGLATAIERDVEGTRVDELLARCASEVRTVGPTGSPLLLGLCCTHYGYVARRLGAAVAGAVGRDVETLDPNGRMARDVMAALSGGPVQGAEDVPLVRVISKVALDESTRSGIAGLVGLVSPATAGALVRYHHVPDLF